MACHLRELGAVDDETEDTAEEQEAHFVVQRQADAYTSVELDELLKTSLRLQMTQLLFRL
jgi:hypothetical protein